MEAPKEPDSAGGKSSQVQLSSVIWAHKLSLYQKNSVNTICAES